MQHVIFGKSQLDLLTTGAWSNYVHDDRDAFLLMSGNNDGPINCEALNAWATTVRSYYPTAPIYAATSGIWNVINGAPCLDKTLFSGMTLVYEPNQANAPEFTWDRATTEETLAYASLVIRENGLESWTKISGRALAGRDKAGEWSYGAFGTFLDGQVIQTQGSCRDIDGDGDFVNGDREFGTALTDVIDQHAASGAASLLHIRITTSSDATNVNTVGSADALQCAEAAWARPEVHRVTLRTAVGDIESLDRATAFYQLREVLLAGAPSVFSRPGSQPPVSAQLPSSGTDTMAGSASSLPADGQIHGTLPAAGLGLIVWGGGPIDVLVGEAEVVGCTPESVWLIEGGEFLGYLANAPAAVNAPFFSHFSGGDLPSAPVIVRCGG